MNATAVIAWKEFSDDFRNRWTVALTVLFALLALAIAWFGGAASGKVGFTSFEATLASLTTLGAFVIPLIGLLIAYDTIVGERSDGTLLLLLSYPLPRSQLVAGKFLGHCLALAAATLVGFGVAIAVMQALQASAQTLEAWLALGRFTLSAALLGACFIGLACLVSALTADKARAAGLALIVWLATVVVFDLVLLALLVVSGGNAIERAVYPYLLLVNPVDVFRLVNLTALGQGAGNELLTGMTAGHGYPAALLWLVLIAWVVVPFGCAMFAFRRKEV